MAPSPLLIRRFLLVLAVLAVASVYPATAEEESLSQAAAAPESETAERPDVAELFEDWKKSDPALEKDKTACVMCAGFGLAIVCGQSCDSTGLTIRKPNGSSNGWCGRCDSGKWKK